MELELLLAQIRSAFAYLFDEYGFQLVYLDPKPERSDSALIGFTSPFCRIAFDWEQGTVTPLIGPPSSTFGQDTKIDGIDQWYNLERMFDFIQKRPFRWPTASETPQRAELLTRWADALRPIAPQLFQHFESRDRVRQWNSEFAAYTMAQIKVRFSSSSPTM
ncbi:MAG: hypothetical protein ACOYNY_13040 [Caldilineaceae bacterium]